MDAKWEAIVLDGFGFARKEQNEVIPGFEPGSLDSESRVLTITPYDQLYSSFQHLQQQPRALCSPTQVHGGLS